MLITLAFLLFILQFYVLPYLWSPEWWFILHADTFILRMVGDENAKGRVLGTLFMLINMDGGEGKSDLLSFPVCFAVSVSPILPSKNDFYVKPTQHGRTRSRWSLTGFHGLWDECLRTAFCSTIQTNKSVWARFAHWRLKIPPGKNASLQICAKESPKRCGTKSVLWLGIITPD